MRILAIDPGTEQSGWCLFMNGQVLAAGVYTNADMLAMLSTDWGRDSAWYADTLAIEMIASYGMAVGREVFETCVWIGRFLQVWREPDQVRLVYRRDVKMHLCGTPKAKDSNIRQAILDLFERSGGGATPQIGTKAKPGPLYGMATHAWPALGVALTATNWARPSN